MSVDSVYHPGLAEEPFYLGRHGESQANAGDVSQGRGEDEPGKPNGLTDEGRQEVVAAQAAHTAAGFNVRHVSSSRLTRAQQSAQLYVARSANPKPELLDPAPDDRLKEVSQKGWEGILDRKTTKQHRREKLDQLKQRLAATGELDDQAIEDYAAWVMRMGDAEHSPDGEEGDSPLEAALAGILALEEYGMRPGELMFSHAMLHRYMDAIATTVGQADRERLRQQLEAGVVLGPVAVIKTLQELGVKSFKITDDDANRQAKGGATAYTVDHNTGKWIAGRRIEPAEPGSGQSYVEQRRNNETGLWERVTPPAADAN